MSITDREDIKEQLELAKTVDIENIPYEQLIGVLIGFICDKLFTTDIFKKLDIDSNNEEMIRRYTLQGAAFINKRLSIEELKKERFAAWTAHDGMADGSASKALLRIIICVLYDREDAEYDVYGSGEILGVVFSSFLDLGSGYCAQLRSYIQENI